MLALAGIPLGLSFRFLDPSPDACARWGSCSSAPTTTRSCSTGSPTGPPSSPTSSRTSRSRPRGGWPPCRSPRSRRRRTGSSRSSSSAGSGSRPREDRRRGRDVPGLLKTRRLGYDGKGQRLVSGPAAGTVPGHVLEERVSFDRELSLLAVRGRDGGRASGRSSRTCHEDGILRTRARPRRRAAGAGPRSTAAAPRRARLRRRARARALRRRRPLLANEFAPRVHNTGHWTIEGAATSQFENHLRAILGLPLGSTASRPAVLAT